MGLYRAFSHDLVVIDDCLIAEEALNTVIHPLRRWLSHLDITIEHVEIVRGDDPQEVVAVGRVTGQLAPREDSVCEVLIDKSSGIDGLVLHGDGWRKAWGGTAVSIRSDEGICLKVEADVFTQVNAEGNRELLNMLLAAAGFDQNDRVLELYAGAGNFTLSVARRAREIVAVEGHGAAIQSAKRSAQFNGIGNIHWIRAHVPAAVERLAKRREHFSKIILDPPRAGAKGVDRDLAALGATKIVYVSCNPATLARDLSTLAGRGYKLAMVQPIDLFPHTFHVETLAIMIR
jgi:23S rRNA (uracil1939-C5)-methyltransferase